MDVGEDHSADAQNVQGSLRMPALTGEVRTLLHEGLAGAFHRAGPDYESLPAERPVLHPMQVRPEVVQLRQDLLSVGTVCGPDLEVAHKAPRTIRPEDAPPRREEGVGDMVEVHNLARLRPRQCAREWLR